MINVNIVNDEFSVINLETQKYIFPESNYILHKKYDSIINELLNNYKFKEHGKNILNYTDEELIKICREIVDLVILDHTNNIIASKFLTIDQCYKVIYFINFSNYQTSFALKDLYKEFNTNRITRLRNFIQDSIKTIYYDTTTFIIDKIIVDVYTNLVYNIYFNLIIATPTYYLSYKPKFFSQDDILYFFKELDEERPYDVFEELKFFKNNFGDINTNYVEVFPITNIINWY